MINDIFVNHLLDEEDATTAAAVPRDVSSHGCTERSRASLAVRNSPAQNNLCRLGEWIFQCAVAQ